MKKLLIPILCLSLLTGCTLPFPLPDLPFSLPDLPDLPFLSCAKATRAPEVVLEPTTAPASTTPEPPTVTAEPEPVPAATETPAPPANQAYAGTYLRFEAPGSWRKVEVPDGAYFYPDLNDTASTFLLYQEAPNEMKLTETSVDVALLFASGESIAAIVEKVLADNGFTDFTLAPVDVKKTKINGLTCYRGASTVTVEGQDHDLSGHIFIRKDRLILLIWAGDEATYAEGLGLVYDSLQAVK